MPDFLVEGTGSLSAQRFLMVKRSRSQLGSHIV